MNGHLTLNATLNPTTSLLDAAPFLWALNVLPRPVFSSPPIGESTNPETSVGALRGCLVRVDGLKFEQGGQRTWSSG